MNTSDIYKFSRLGYCVIMTRELNMFWADVPELYKKLISLRGFKAAKDAAFPTDSPFEQRFTYSGVKYRALMLPLNDGHYMCRVYPEECFLKHSYSEMYSCVTGIKNDAVSMISGIEELKERLAGDGLLDEYRDLLDGQMKSAEAVLADSRSITKLFDTEHMCEYVPINTMLSFTVSRLKKFNIELGKTVDISVSIEKSVARINYTVFEAAVLGISKLLYMIMNAGGDADIRIKGRENGSISIYSSTAFNKKFDFNRIERDIRILNCMFESLSGHSRFYRADNNFIVKASVPAYLSNYVNRIKTDDEIFDNIEDVPIINSLGSFMMYSDGNNVEFCSSKKQPEISVSVLLTEIILGELLDPSFADRH